VTRRTAVLFATLIVPIYVFSDRGTAWAGCTKPACFAQTRWHAGFTAVIIDSPLGSIEHKLAIDLIEAQGGYVGLHSNHVLLGWIPVKADHLLIGQHGIRRIHRMPGVARPPQRPTTMTRPRSDDALFDFFEAVVSGELASQVDKSVDTVGAPLTGDAFDNPTLTNRLWVTPQALPKLPLPRPLRHLTAHPENTNGPPWTNESMRGEVCVAAFELESDGSIDQSIFDWQVSQFPTITTEILNGFAWWADQARSRGITLHIGIAGVWEPYALQAHTGYEPLADLASDDYLWLNDILRKQDTNPPYSTDPTMARPGGFGASPVTPANVFAMAEQYNAYVNSHLGCQYGFTILVAADNGIGWGFPYTRTPMETQQRSYSYYGGPVVQTTYTNQGWGPMNFHLVMWHETGHIFWACDEYYDAPSNTGCFTCTGDCRTYGPRLGIGNANCGNPNVSGCQPHAMCIMDRFDQGLALCNITPLQIGW